MHWSSSLSLVDVVLGVCDPLVWMCCRGSSSWSWCDGDAAQCPERTAADPESSAGAVEPLQVLQHGAETQQTRAAGTSSPDLFG